MWQLIPANASFDFVGRRKIALGISAALILISLLSLLVRGLAFGIDFTGGTLLEVRFAQPPKIGEIRAIVRSAGYGGAVIQEFGAPNDILIRVQNKEGEASSQISTKILRALKERFGDAVEMRRVEYVGPQVGKELARAGIMAVLIAMLAILVYVAFRFELRFALGADLALLHDVTITLGVFSITGKEITLPVVAAILTIIGYSLNDTIVVFDRIREHFAANRKRKRPEPEPKLANAAINETLSRTIITSLTTLLVVLALFFFGGEVIHDFAFALIVGVLVGTYSSIFIATPLVLALEGKLRGDEALERELEARP